MHTKKRRLLVIANQTAPRPNLDHNVEVASLDHPDHLALFIVGTKGGPSKFHTEDGACQTTDKSVPDLVEEFKKEYPGRGAQLLSPEAVVDTLNMLPEMFTREQKASIRGIS